MTPKKYWFKKGTISKNLHCFKTLLQKYFLTVYYERNLHSMMPIFLKRQECNKYNWAKHTYSYLVCWGGLGRRWIENPPQPKLLMGLMHLLSLEDSSSVSGLNIHPSIFYYYFFFLFLVFLLGPASVIRLLSEDQWAV